MLLHDLFDELVSTPVDLMLEKFSRLDRLELGFASLAKEMRFRFEGGHLDIAFGRHRSFPCLDC
jgi:hypothetical protein